MKLNDLLKNKTFLVFFAAVILNCILFYPVVFQNNTFGSADNLNPKAAGIILKQTQEEQNVYPQWQPWSFSGMPTAEAFTNISALYFPNYLLNLLFIKGTLAMVFHLVFAGLGGYLLLRYLKLSFLPALFGGFGFMMTPYMFDMLVFGHGSQMMTAAYIPWIFWAVIHLYKKTDLLSVGLLALLMGFQLQRAHAQIAYYTWMLVGAYIVYQFVLALIKKEGVYQTLKSTGWFVGAAILAFGLALIIYLPSMEYTEYSIRGAGAAGGTGYNYATGWSFHPKEILTFFIPSAYGFGGQTYWGEMPFTDYPNYMGIIILTMAVFGLIFHKNQIKWFLLVISILALFTSFGKFFSPVYDLFYNWLPYFNKFRVPHMILIILQFNTAVLAAFGLEAIANLSFKAIPKWFWRFIIVIGVSGILLLLSQNGIKSHLMTVFKQPPTNDLRVVQYINNLRWEMWWNDAWKMMLFIAATVALIWLWFKQTISKNIFLASITVLALVDIAVIDFQILKPGENSGRGSQVISNRAIERHFQPDEVINYILSDKDKPFRIYPVGNLFMDARFKAFGIESIGGYHPAKLAVYNQFLQKTNNVSSLPLMRLLNVRYLVADQQINHPELIHAFSGSYRTSRGNMNTSIFEITDYLPRAWFVKEVVALQDREMIWPKIVARDFDPAQTAFINSEIKLPGNLGLGQVVSYNQSIHNIILEVENQEAGFLVLSEVYYPLRWKAFLDNEPVETIEVNNVIRGIVVPAGKHTIEFIYDRSSFRLASMVSFAALFICLFMVGWASKDNIIALVRKNK